VTASNPFLERTFRIPFHRMDPSHVVPAVQEILARAEDARAALAGNPDPPTWENTVAALDTLTERVRRVTNPIHHLLAVAESPELRKGWNEVLPQVTTFWSRLYLDREILTRLRGVVASPEARALDDLHRRHLARTIREFERAGAGLEDRDRARLEAIDVELSRLEQSFSEHVLDATAAWSLHLLDPARLEGIPEDALERFQTRARSDEKEGWVIGLDAPSVQAVLRHARDRELRRTVFEANLARGKEDPWDNRPLIPRILELRREKARLLGYEDFPDFRLEEQMAHSGARAREFLEEMRTRTTPYWERDLAELRGEAQGLGLDALRPWDVSWVMEEIRKARFDLDEEELRPYFPLDRVLEGLFELARRLFGVVVHEVEIEERWHPDVRYHELRSEDGHLLGAFYADLFPRPEKRQGAWMSDFIYGVGGDPHLANICANFPPPSERRPALLSHRDVETLFHEFGHLLHHCTSRVPIEGRGGINVAWDWVELPSQLLENWCWEEEALARFSGHWESGEPLPAELFRKMEQTRRFMGGWIQMRQISFGIMDLALHTEFDPATHGDPVAWATDRILDLAPDREFAGTHPLTSFLHLFSGGYAASYYAYLWSEVLEADLFSRFRDEGIFSRSVGEAFLDTILSRGDEKDPDLLFRDFMGRDPDPEPLLRRNLGAMADAEEAA
jgi:oligopeptidase A